MKRIAGTMAAVLLSCLVLLRCGGGDGLNAEERAHLDRGSSALSSVQQTVAIADSLFDFDPTIDPNLTAAQNAQAILANTNTNLNGCGSASISGTTVTVSFGAPPGCTLRTGVQVSGAVTAAVSRLGPVTTVAL